MRATRWLRDDRVDHTQPLEVGRGNAEMIGDLRGTVSIAIEDGRSALRTGHGVNGVLLHKQPVGDGEGECAARAAFADHGGDCGNGGGGHRGKAV